MRIALFLALFAGAAFAQAPKDGPKGPPPATSVKAVAAKVANAVDEAGAVGTLRADEAVTIRPEIAGRVVEIRFNEGQAIARGALLVKLDQSELAAVVPPAARSSSWKRRSWSARTTCARKASSARKAWTTRGRRSRAPGRSSPRTRRGWPRPRCGPRSPVSPACDR
jgi:membrane fusion protein (multidrug efflux system)